jgi:hypothetical protein
MAIVNKNFRVKNGLIVDGSVATVNGYNVLTEASTAFIISTIGGSADSANTPNSVVKRDGNGNFAAGTITATFLGNVTGDVTGTVSSISNHDTNDLAEGTGAGSNLYFTNARALSATAAAYDAAGAAAAATANAATDATAKVAAEATARNSAIASAIATEVADRNTAIATAKAAAEAVASADATSKANAAQAAAATDATTKANAAQAAAEATAAAALSTAISTEVSARNTAIGTAVDSLVDGAPALLNTLNELAAAINDDANYTTTITTALGTKAPLASPALTGVPTAPTAPTNTNSTQIATTEYADQAASVAAGYASDVADDLAAHELLTSGVHGVTGDVVGTSDTQTLSSKTISGDLNFGPFGDKISSSQGGFEITGGGSLAVGSTSGRVVLSGDQGVHIGSYDQSGVNLVATQGALDDVLDGTSAFTAVNVNDVAVVKAATTTVSSASTVNALTWAAADYRTAKALVKFKNGANTQVSEILLTLDTSNNVAITEFGSIGTNGDLGSISAAYVSGNVSISVTTVYASTDVMVYATLIK